MHARHGQTESKSRPNFLACVYLRLRLAGLTPLKNIHEVIGPRDRVILVQETETIIKNKVNERFLIPASCPITKAGKNSRFHSSHFFALYFPSQYEWFFLSLLPFLILEIKKNKCEKKARSEDNTTSRPLNKFELCESKFVPGCVAKYEYPVF